MVGSNCRFLAVSKNTFGSEPYLVSIGDHVTVTEEVKFVTHDGGLWVFRQDFPEIDVIRPIKIGSNVFIGLRSTILPGVTVGNNVVIAAGSVVTKSFGSNVVIGGVPAKVIKSISDYREKILEQSIKTKSLTPAMKRQILLEKFGRILESER